MTDRLQPRPTLTTDAQQPSATSTDGRADDVRRCLKNLQEAEREFTARIAHLRIYIQQCEHALAGLDAVRLDATTSVWSHNNVGGAVLGPEPTADDATVDMAGYIIVNALNPSPLTFRES